jgi:ElaB/YqjD/DUF883 family membrane-anchored ribosome-binding protein
MAVEQTGQWNTKSGPARTAGDTDAMGNAVDKVMDVASDSAQTVKAAAIASHDFLRKLMEDNPHTTTAIALGIGLLIGYSARRQPPRRGWWD